MNPQPKRLFQNDKSPFSYFCSLWSVGYATWLKDQADNRNIGLSGYGIVARIQFERHPSYITGHLKKGQQTEPKFISYRRNNANQQNWRKELANKNTPNKSTRKRQKPDRLLGSGRRLIGHMKKPTENVKRRKRNRKRSIAGKKRGGMSI